MKKFLLSVFCAALMGCNAQSPESIKGNTYVLTDSPEGLEITLAFETESPRFHGKAVNGYFGGYELDGTNLKVMPIASTMMAAPEPLMKAESAYFQTLQSMNKISVKNDTLTLSNGNEQLVFKKQAPSVDDADQAVVVEETDEAIAE